MAAEVHDSGPRRAGAATAPNQTRPLTTPDTTTHSQESNVEPIISDTDRKPSGPSMTVTPDFQMSITPHVESTAPTAARIHALGRSANDQQAAKPRDQNNDSNESHIRCADESHNPTNARGKARIGDDTGAIDASQRLGDHRSRGTTLSGHLTERGGAGIEHSRKCSFPLGYC